MTSQTPPDALLGPDDFDAIDTILDDLRQREEEIPQWEFCEGFMAALVCTRREIAPEEYFHILLGEDATPPAADAPMQAGRLFADPIQQQRFFDLWSQRWAEIVAALSPKPLAGRRVLITAGPTYEALDPVRGITNRSSGKMGYALARAAFEAGAEVTLVSGPVALKAPRGVSVRRVESAREMLAAVQAAWPGQDVFIATAAVADWRPAQEAGQKIKKDGSGEVPALAFVENPDILATMAARADGTFCVGFAAESEHLVAHAQAKRLRKGVPLLVGNLGPATFGRDDNALVLVDEAGVSELPEGALQGVRADKQQLAGALVLEIAARLAARQA